MAGGAGIAVGAVGSLLNMGAQQRAANRQRQQIDMQLKQARQDMMVQRERFEITKAAAQDNYFRERILLDTQHDLARLQQQEQEIAQESQKRQLSYQQKQLEAAAKQQISQVLSAKANAETNAQLSAGQGLRTLADTFMQSEALGERLYTELTARGVGIESLDEMRRLNDVQTLQAGLEGINTVDRQREYMTGQLEGQQGLVQSQANTASSYLQSTREYQNKLNQLMNEYGAQDLQYTYNRNQIAAEANQYAQQAGILGQEGAASLNYRNQVNNLMMSRSQIQNPNWLAGILNIGAQFAPQIGDAVTGLFNSGGSTPPQQIAPPHVGGGGGILSPPGGGIHGMGNTATSNPYWGNYNPGIITDVTGNTWG